MGREPGRRRRTSFSIGSGTYNVQLNEESREVARHGELTSRNMEQTYGMEINSSLKRSREMSVDPPLSLSPMWTMLEVIRQITVLTVITFATIYTLLTSISTLQQFTTVGGSRMANAMVERILAVHDATRLLCYPLLVMAIRNN